MEVQFDRALSAHQCSHIASTAIDPLDKKLNYEISDIKIYEPT